jgi:ABC-2 type transport system ATP-binding protein
MIRFEDVAKRYGSFTAVHPMNMHVRKGEVFGFLGPNGAGKTTTIRMLAGVLGASSGRIFIDGLETRQHPVETRRRVGYIPDRPYLYEKLTAREFMAFIGGIYGVETDIIHSRGEALLDENDLLDRADELVESYSHGMKQRLVLSAARLHEPPLLIVDEPMVGLDPHGARRIKDTFRAIAESGRTVFLSTHSLDTAQEVCDRVGILYKGQIIRMGTVDEILSSAAGEDLEQVFLEITEEARSHARTAEESV